MGRSYSIAGKITRNLIKIVLIILSLISPILKADNATVQANDTPSTCILRWGKINTPGSFPQKNDITTPCEINVLVASAEGETLYALDIPNASSMPVTRAGIWKSTDGGISWSMHLSRWLAQTTPAPVFPITDIAVAPDDPDFIAVVCTGTDSSPRREIYLSEDGGTNWNYCGQIPWTFGHGEQICNIAISPSYSYLTNKVRDIIAGSRMPTDGVGKGELYVLRYPGLSSWQAQGFTGGDIIATVLSPAYVNDGTIIVMASTTQRTYINLVHRDFASNSSFFNKASGWPVELCSPDQTGGINSGKSKIITGYLALPTDFNGEDFHHRLIFAAYDSNGLSAGTKQPLDDVYRLNDTVVTRMKIPAHQNNPRISSIAYSGTTTSGKLAVGSVLADSASGQGFVWLTSEPLLQYPCWTKPLKPPTGGYTTGYANVKLAWLDRGRSAICGTGTGNRDTPQKWASTADISWSTAPLDESSFSISHDDGLSWNQLGLIDTRISRLQAVEASGEGGTLYLSTVNDNGLDSTWRSTTLIAGEGWERILCQDSSAPLLRLAPDIKDSSVIFLGNGGENRLSYSRDSGQTWNDCMPGAILQDFASSNSNTLIVLQADGLIRRGTYKPSGWQWSKFIDTGINPAHSICVLNDNVIAGAALGDTAPAAYSTDGGYQWQIITQPTYGYGNKHVAFDDDFKNNRIIYLAEDSGGIYRWAIGTNVRWDDMSSPNGSYYGITSRPRDTLYAAYSSKNNGVDRTLYSRAGIPKNGVSWDSLATGLPAGIIFRLEPTALVCHGDTIWSIDARNYDPSMGEGMLWAFKDTLAIHGPWLISPTGGSLIGCDPVTGRNAQVDLKWEQLSLADAYEVEIGKDKWFDLPISTAAPSNNPFYTPADLLYPAYFIDAGLLPEAGKTYYWHIRVRRAATGQVIRSPWSYTLIFSVSPGFPVVERVSTAAEDRSMPTTSSEDTRMLLSNSLTAGSGNSTNALLIVLISVLLFGLAVQVIIYYRH